MRRKDAHKQLARTSLKSCFSFFVASARKQHTDKIKVSFEPPHGIWLLFYEPLPLFQLFQLKSAIEIYEDGMIEPSSFPGSRPSSRSEGRGGEREILGTRL